MARRYSQHRQIDADICKSDTLRFLCVGLQSYFCFSLSNSIMHAHATTRRAKPMPNMICMSMSTCNKVSRYYKTIIIKMIIIGVAITIFNIADTANAANDIIITTMVMITILFAIAITLTPTSVSSRPSV